MLRNVPHIVIIIIVTISSISVIITLGQYRLAVGTLAGAGGKAREGGSLALLMAAARVEAIRKRFTGSSQGRGTELELVAASTRGFTHGLLRNYPGQGRRPAAGPTAPLGRHLDAVREAGQSAGSGRWSRCLLLRCFIYLPALPAVSWLLWLLVLSFLEVSVKVRQSLRGESGVRGF